MRWMWIDRITDFEAERRLVAIKAVSLAEEHLHEHFAAVPAAGLEADPVMPGPLVIEGMAQTAGILVGSVHRFREKVVLAKVSRAELPVDFRPGEVIRFVAMLERIDAQGAQCSGTVERLDPLGRREPEPAGRIDLMFAHADRNLAGVSFPEENFVFSDNFRFLLRDAGLAHLADD